MLKKIGLVTLIIGCVIVAYWILTGVMSMITQLAVDTANFTAVTGNLSSDNFTGSAEAMRSAPLWVYFLPAVIGGIAILVVLKSK